VGAFDDIAAARALVATLTKQLDDAKAALATQEANLVVGGPDVSKVQGDVNWVAVRGAGYDICFPKVADGDIVDTTFSPGRITNINAAGLSYSPYYFGRVANPANGERDARAECAMAVYFATKQGWGKPGDLPLVLDFENDSLMGQPAAKAAAHLILFLKAYKGLMGHYAWLYSNPSTLGVIVPAMSDADKQWLVSNHPLWIAHIGAPKPTVTPWSDWTFWQYTDAGTIPGITGKVDINRANITKAQLDGLRLR
jgi:lysozyme